MPVKKRVNPEKLKEKRLKYKPHPAETYRLKLKKKKPRTGEGPAGVKRKVKAKSYDEKRKSFRESKIDEFSVGGIAKAAKTLINKYKPKIKNQKEDYGLYSKQDYSGIIKEAEKTQRRKRRNRAGAVVGGAAAAAAIQSKKDKENKK